MNAFNPNDRVVWTRHGWAGTYVEDQPPKRAAVDLDIDRGGGARSLLLDELEPEVTR